MVFHKYNQLLKAHPFKMNMFTTGILFSTGDVAAQSLFPHRDHDGNLTGFNGQRTLRAWIYGTFFFAPISVCWFVKTLPFIKNPFLSHSVRLKMSNKRQHVYDTLFRLSIDQLFVPGLVWIPLYNTVMVTLAGHSNIYEVVKEKLEANWWNVLSANWAVWPMFQLVSLSVIPVHLRIVCANIYSIGWNCFLSFVHNTPGRGKHSGHRIEELVDIEDEEEEITMVYS